MELLKVRLVYLCIPALAVVSILSCTIGFRVDPADMAHAELGDISPPLELSWKKQFDAGVADEPVIVGRTLLVPLLNGELVALNLYDGKKLDRKRFGRVPGGGLTVSNGVVYWTIGREKKWLTAYDLAQGRYLWKVSLGSVESSAAVGAGRVYVGSLNHHFYCLDAESGKTMWNRKEEAAITISPALYADRVYYCDEEGGVYSRNRKDGTSAWHSSLPGKPYSPPVVSNGRVYVTTSSGSLFCLDPGDGRILWTENLGAPIFASVSADTSNVYVPVSSGKVYSLRHDGGKMQWTYDAGTIVNSRMRVAGSFLIVVALRGDIILLERSTGKPVWMHTLDRRIVAPPVTSQGFLIVADDRKRIHAFISPDREGKDQQ